MRILTQSECIEISAGAIDLTNPQTIVGGVIGGLVTSTLASFIVYPSLVAIVLAAVGGGAVYANGGKFPGAAVAAAAGGFVGYYFTSPLVKTAAFVAGAGLGSWVGQKM
ncbi:MAG: hypothetical protein ACHQJ6_06415 [Candidatus Berkiellales bacterium]